MLAGYVFACIFRPLGNFFEMRQLGILEYIACIFISVVWALVLKQAWAIGLGNVVESVSTRFLSRGLVQPPQEVEAA